MAETNVQVTTLMLFFKIIFSILFIIDSIGFQLITIKEKDLLPVGNEKYVDVYLHTASKISSIHMHMLRSAAHGDVGDINTV